MANLEFVSKNWAEKGTILSPLGWHKNFFGFFFKLVWKNTNELFGQPSSMTPVVKQQAIFSRLHGQWLLFNEMPVVVKVTGNFLQSWWKKDTPFLDNNPNNSFFYFQISLWVDLAWNLKAIFCWFLKMKVIYFLSFSVTDLVLGNTEYRIKKGGGISLLGSVLT